jgi:prepilin signal peptidase PulO-like enzyme (type II secretory pathway)
VILYLFIFFILGSAIGSFLNVVIDRTTRGETILGRSYCNHCRAKLGTLDLVPIISFFGLGAKCRYCKKPLSWQYPLVESVTAVLFVFTFCYLAASNMLVIPSLLYYLFLISVVEVVAVVDWKFSLIPTTFVFAASVVSLFYNYFVF